MTNKKYFILTFGQPGSGKGSIRKHFFLNIIGKIIGDCEDLTCTTQNKIYDANVDKLVEMDPKYKSEMVKLSKEFPYKKEWEKCKVHECTTALNQWKKTFSSKASNIYFTIRKDKTKNYIQKSLDDMNDFLVDYHVLQGYNIVMETTGTHSEKSTLNWFKNNKWGIKKFRDLGYTVVIVIPYVCPNNIVSRLESRFKRAMQANKVGRLPDTDIDNIKKNDVQVLNNLWALIKENVVDIVYVYNNNVKFGETPLRCGRDNMGTLQCNLADANSLKLELDKLCTVLSFPYLGKIGGHKKRKISRKKPKSRKKSRKKLKVIKKRKIRKSRKRSKSNKKRKKGSKGTFNISEKESRQKGKSSKRKVVKKESRQKGKSSKRKVVKKERVQLLEQPD